jgi:hypothetical protein
LKKYVLFITLAVALLAAAAYLFQRNLLPTEQADAWDIIPATALIVYERDKCQPCIADIHQSPVWKIIENASFYHKDLDSLKASLQKTLSSSSQDLIISIHPIKKDDFDFVFYLPALHEQLNDITKEFNNKKYRLTKREFNNVDIHEIGFSKQVFSWAFVGDVWIGSFTPFLVEDVIRTAVKKNGLKQSLSSSKKLPQIGGDAGNIYLQLNNFSDWLSLFYADNNPITESLGQATVLDVKSDVDHIVLNGFSIDTTDRSKYLLSIFRNQSPVSFNLKNYISTNTIALHSFGVSKGKSFNEDLGNFAKQRAPRIRDSLNMLSQRAGINLNHLYENIQDEVGLCYVESAKGKRHSKILIIETNEVKPWLSAFEKLEETLSVDTIFYERYGDYEIREVPVFRFPEKMFWPLITGFNQSFYTSMNNMVFIGENLQELKNFLTDIEEDNTWGRSVSHNKFLETTLLESNLSIYINTPKVWNVLSLQLQPKWSQFIRENQALLRSIQLSAIQFSHLNNSYYTNVSISYKPVQGIQNTKEHREKFVTNFDRGIRALYPVKSHVDRSDEILVQDSINDLSLVSDEGTVLWKVPLGDKITTEVTQIDYFGNGKLQYFFATRSGLHVIDRLGNYVTPFPALLSPINFEYGTVVDYDHSKKYRFLVADDRGKLWMYDREMNNLDGWQPKELGSPLTCTPRHHRIKGKDYIIAITRDGKAHLMNRRGETLRNFPLDLHARVSGDYFLESGTGLSDTYFVVVSDDGFRIRFSLDGKIQSREPLIKTSISSRFKLLAEKKLSAYIIIQQEADHFNILDESGKRIISNEAIGLSHVAIAYDDFGGGRVYITVMDTDQNLSYIYDGSGDLVTSVPIETSMLELRPKDSDENRVYFVHGKALNIYPIGR